MIYICECGKEFDRPASFAGHKSHCKIHALKVGKLMSLLESENRRHEGMRETYKSIKQARFKDKISELQLELQQWISEKHTCERCGKVMTEKFATGRFCSRSCANGKPHSEETKRKIGEAVKKTDLKNKISEHRKENRYLKYKDNPNKCIICEKPLSYEIRNRKTCSEDCKKILQRKLACEAAERRGGNLNPHPNKNCKTGNYKGFHYDSSWELAFIIYHIDNNIVFERNKRGFSYVVDGKEHKYYPDFIKDGIYYEIKNFDSEWVHIKSDQFPSELTLKILYKDEIKPYLDYCINKYGNNFWEIQ